MKIYLFTIIALFIFSVSANAFDFGIGDPAFSLHKGNYIQSVRNEEGPYTQAQFSLKYRPLKHDAANIFVGYTKTFWWMTSEKSSEIRETNYNVELFYKKKNIIQLSKSFSLNVLELGIAHKSNGKKGADSRSIDYVFMRGGGYFGKKLRIGGEITAFTYINKSVKNEDIRDHTGNFAYKIYASLFSRHHKKNIIHLSYMVQLGNNTNFSQGNQEILLKTHFFPKYISPVIFIKYETGYGTQGLAHYNEKHSAAIIGICLR